MKRAMFKWPIPMETEWHLEAPMDFIPRTVAIQQGQPMLWAEVNPEAPKTLQGFALVGTGHLEIEEPWTYVGTFLTNGGLFVWHVYWWGAV